MLFGPVEAVTAEVSTRRRATKIIETGKLFPLNTPDNATLALRFTGGLSVSIHYRGGVSCGTNLLWEINGTRGDGRQWPRPDGPAIDPRCQRRHEKAEMTASASPFENPAWQR